MLCIYNSININFAVVNDKKKNRDSALRVQAGIEQPSAVNPNIKKGIGRFKKQLTNPAVIVEGIKKGDRSALSRGITIVESALTADKIHAREIINSCLPFAGKSVRIGITGVPGVGKSTFIESFGNFLISKGHKVAVLAIDPSSKRTKGSILGDKTRMESLSVNPDAFIRPSASAGTLGGVARKTRETITLCEAAGFDVILVETVGVGQSEIAVAQIVDFFLLLMLAGSGDELQGIKRGIMEMADLILINKADGDNITRAQLAKREFENALHLFPALENGWIPKVQTTSAIMNKGMDDVWQSINEYIDLTKSNAYFKTKRKEQSVDILRDSLEGSIMDSFYTNPEIKSLLKDIEDKIAAGLLNPYDAAESLVDLYLKKK